MPRGRFSKAWHANGRSALDMPDCTLPPVAKQVILAT